MTAHRYADTVIGSIVDLPFTVRDRRTRALVNLETASAAATCKIVDEHGAVIVPAGVCTFASTQGKYRWDTTGLAPGTYRVQFPLSAGLDPVPIIEPAEPAVICLVAPI